MCGLITEVFLKHLVGRMEGSSTLFVVFSDSILVGSGVVGEAGKRLPLILATVFSHVFKVMLALCCK